VPLREQAPFAALGDLALGAFELREDDVHRAALRAGLIERSIVEELRPELRRVQAMLGARQAPTRRHLADAIAEDLRGFLTHHRCSRGVVVSTLPGPRSVPAHAGFTAAEVRKALEESADWISAGAVYAHAAADAGCAFVGAGQDAALCVPGVAALFEEKSLPIAGAGLLEPAALLREMLAQTLETEALPLSGTASLSTAAIERGARLWGGPDRTSEMALGAAWAGGALELSVELRGQVALYLAARAFDAALLVELAMRAGRKGAQEWMEALFAQRLSSAVPREATALSLAERRARMVAELPALARSAGREAA